MTLITLNDGAPVTPKIFGHLYMAVFSNGTVKAGTSRSDPWGRVTAHAGSGRNFGIFLDAAFYAAIYTPDAKRREKLMHKDIAFIAPIVSGREWFKFSCPEKAAKFASTYLSRVERMSLAERPSPEVIEKTELQKNNKWFDFVRHQPAPNAQVETVEIEEFLSSYKPATVIALAIKFMDHEGGVAQSNHDFDAGVPLLSKVIDDHFDVAYAHVRQLPPADRIAVDSTPNIETAKKIIRAAAQYREFFMAALLVTEAA